MAGENVPCAVDVVVAIVGGLVLELASSLARACGGAVLAERLVVALAFRESGALSFADGGAGARDPSATSDGVLAAGGGIREGAAALLALVADEHALCLGSASGLVDDVTAEFGA